MSCRMFGLSLGPTYSAETRCWPVAATSVSTLGPPGLRDRPPETGLPGPENTEVMPPREEPKADRHTHPCDTGTRREAQPLGASEWHGQERRLGGCQQAGWAAFWSVACPQAQRRETPALGMSLHYGGRARGRLEAGGWSLAGGADPEPLRGLTAGLDSQRFLSCSTAHCLQGT